MKTNQIAETNLNRFDQGRLGASHLPHVTRRWVRKATRHRVSTMERDSRRRFERKKRGEIEICENRRGNELAMKTLAQNKRRILR